MGRQFRKRSIQQNIISFRDHNRRFARQEQDVRRALQQMTRAAASLQLMSDYIEQHPESLIRGKTPEVDRNEK